MPAQRRHRRSRDARRWLIACGALLGCAALGLVEFFALLRSRLQQAQRSRG